MNIMSSWEAETKELIDRVQKEIDEIKADIEKRIATLQQRKWALEESLRAYGEMRGPQVAQTYSLKASDFEGKSLKEVLALIAQRNDDLLIARHAIRLMKEADLFSNPLNADSVVYSILTRSPDFIKVGRGVYRLNSKRRADRATKAQTKNGIQDAVKELKEANPTMTKGEIRDILMRRGFDFEGKNPAKAVHMAWVNLGYAKKEKEAQQIALMGLKREPEQMDSKFVLRIGA